MQRQMKKLIPITLFAILSLVGCASSHDGADDQFQRQEKRAHDCREMQDKLVANQSLTAAARRRDNQDHGAGGMYGPFTGSLKLGRDRHRRQISPVTRSVDRELLRTDKICWSF